MPKLVKDQINLNSIILIVITALVGFGIKKLDEINTSVVKLHTRVDYLERIVTRSDERELQ